MYFEIVGLPAERAAVRKTLGLVTGASGPRLEALTARVFRDFAMCFSDLVSTNRQAAASIRVAASCRWTGCSATSRRGASWPGRMAPRLHPGYRPNGGFLTPEQWTAALEAAGFLDVRVLPDIARIRDVVPTFYVAALGATRP